MSNQPWKAEPNRVEWVEPTTGLPCLLLRAESGTWCGYVGVTSRCPWWRVDYLDFASEPLVHGGVTFTGRLRQPITEPAVLHELLELGLIPDELWWVGFDCNHLKDLMPNGTFQKQWEAGKVYRDLSYVTAEVVNLALQAIEASRRDG